MIQNKAQYGDLKQLFREPNKAQSVEKAQF